MILAQALAPKDVEAATPASAPSLQIALVVPDMDLPSASANFFFFLLFSSFAYFCNVL